MTLLSRKFKDVDDIDLMAIVESYLDAEAADEFAELERRFWVLKLTVQAQERGLTLQQFFAERLRPGNDTLAA